MFMRINNNNNNNNKKEETKDHRKEITTIFVMDHIP